MSILSRSINPQDPDAPSVGKALMTMAKWGLLYAAICYGITAIGVAMGL